MISTFCSQCHYSYSHFIVLMISISCIQWNAMHHFMNLWTHTHTNILSYLPVKSQHSIKIFKLMPITCGDYQNKVSLQTSLVWRVRNLSNFLYIFILSVNFETRTIGLHYILHVYKISRRSKINCYTIKEMLNFQFFVI